jgi:hypothetical protein
VCILYIDSKFNDIDDQSDDLITNLQEKFNHSMATKETAYLHTNSSLLTRESLQWDPRVSTALNTLWYAFDINHDGAIDAEEYVELHKKMWRCYINSLEGWTEAISKADWERDRAGFGTLNYSRFRKCFFEMTDVHTDTMDVDEYCSFLDAVLEKLGVAHLKDEAAAELRSKRRQSVAYAAQHQAIANEKAAKAKRMVELAENQAKLQRQLAKEAGLAEFQPRDTAMRMKAYGKHATGITMTPAMRKVKREQGRLKAKSKAQQIWLQKLKLGRGGGASVSMSTSGSSRVGGMKVPPLSGFGRSNSNSRCIDSSRGSTCSKGSRNTGRGRSRPSSATSVLSAVSSASSYASSHASYASHASSLLMIPGAHSQRQMQMQMKMQRQRRTHDTGTIPAPCASLPPVAGKLGMKMSMNANAKVNAQHPQHMQHMQHMQCRKGLKLERPGLTGVWSQMQTRATTAQNTSMSMSMSLPRNAMRSRKPRPPSGRLGASNSKTMNSISNSDSRALPAPTVKVKVSVRKCAPRQVGSEATADRPVFPRLLKGGL